MTHPLLPAFLRSLENLDFRAAAAEIRHKLHLDDGDLLPTRAAGDWPAPAVVELQLFDVVAHGHDFDSAVVAWLKAAHEAAGMARHAHSAIAARGHLRSEIGAVLGEVALRTGQPFGTMIAEMAVMASEKAFEIDPTTAEDLLLALLERHAPNSEARDLMRAKASIDAAVIALAGGERVAQRQEPA